jgi:hypothetical protein
LGCPLTPTKVNENLLRKKGALRPLIRCTPSPSTNMVRHFNLHLYNVYNAIITMRKKRCFAIKLVTQFLSYIKHLQLTVFMHCACYQTSCKSCKSRNSLYIWCNSLQLNYNFVVTTPFQLLYNSLMIIIIMSCWCHFHPSIKI